MLSRPRQLLPRWLFVGLVASCLGILPAFSAVLPGNSLLVSSLQWNTNRNRVRANIDNGNLKQLLAKIAAATGWQVFLEPSASHNVSAKFNDVPPGEALHLLLGELNYALVPGTNSGQRLFVFRTGRENATQLVRPSTPPNGKLIPNELIVRLKPGANIEDLARQLGAKVIGHIDSMNAYRLEFEDAAAADAARQQLADNPQVAAVDSNYSVDAPPTPGPLAASTLAAPQLQLKPPPDNGKVVVGLIDTAVQPLGNNLDQFMLKQISVAGDAQLDPNTPSHGTSMAETILRSIQAVTQGSTSVQILPVDVYGPNESTSTFDVANGIVQAINSGARVINLSLGSPEDSPFLHNIIQQALDQNILFFASAGNQGGTLPMYPAAYAGVNPVTALDPNGQIASYADRGSWVSLGAPGTSIIVYGNQPWYVVGTSPAAAFTSGLAAGYMDVNHSTTAQAQSFVQSNFALKPASGQ